MISPRSRPTVAICLTRIDSRSLKGGGLVPIGARLHRSPCPRPQSHRTFTTCSRALQFLEIKVPGGWEKRRLSFRALDIEQIGHVYEGLLDHTVRRATEIVLSLEGKEAPRRFRCSGFSDEVVQQASLIRSSLKETEARRRRLSRSRYRKHPSMIRSA